MGCTFSQDRKSTPTSTGRDDISNYGGPYKAEPGEQHINYRIQPVNVSKKHINPDIGRMFGI